MKDIVYFVKDSPKNEELRYSLRTVEQNFPFNKVWVYGGLPNGIKPDEYVYCEQIGSKWQRVRNMVRKVCDNDEITEDFWLFNDDFFILKPIREPINYYDKTLEDRVAELKARHGESEYSRLLKELIELLKENDLPTNNYAVHMPMLVNRKKMAEVLDKYPNQPMFRALYGNYWQIGGEQKTDIKVRSFMPIGYMNLDMVSSSDQTWIRPVGTFVRNKFPQKSRFEI